MLRKNTLKASELQTLVTKYMQFPQSIFDQQSLFVAQSLFGWRRQHIPSLAVCMIYMIWYKFGQKDTSITTGKHQTRISGGRQDQLQHIQITSM